MTESMTTCTSIRDACKYMLGTFIVFMLATPCAYASPYYMWQTSPGTWCTSDATLQSLCGQQYSMVEDIANAIFSVEASHTENSDYHFTYDYISYAALPVNSGPPTTAAQSTGVSVTFKMTFIPKNGNPSFSSVYTTSTIGAQSSSVLLYYIKVTPPPKADNGPCCTDPGKALFADPINPATGNTTSSEPDLLAPSTNALAFNRYYNSRDSSQNTLGTGWRGSFTRSIQANAKIASYQPLDPNAVNSSLYNDEATACTSGFAQIKAQVSNWALATANFSNGVCLLSQGGSSLGALPIYAAYNYQTAAETSPPSFDAIRDDGQAIRFSVINGVITAPPSSRFTLQQTGSGYTLSDANDNVETYDTTGKLLSVKSRSGVVQTMNYDSAGRLNNVTDNFGHQLTLGYDGQNRLISVTQQ